MKREQIDEALLEICEPLHLCSVSFTGKFYRRLIVESQTGMLSNFDPSSADLKRQTIVDIRKLRQVGDT